MFTYFIYYVAFDIWVEEKGTVFRHLSHDSLETDKRNLATGGLSYRLKADKTMISNTQYNDTTKIHSPVENGFQFAIKTVSGRYNTSTWVYYFTNITDSNITRYEAKPCELTDFPEDVHTQLEFYNITEWYCFPQNLQLYGNYEKSNQFEYIYFEATR